MTFLAPLFLVLANDWAVPRHDARPNTVPGGSAMRSDQFERYEVRSTEGETLVVLRPR